MSQFALEKEISVCQRNESKILSKCLTPQKDSECRYTSLDNGKAVGILLFRGPFIFMHARHAFHKNRTFLLNGYRKDVY